VIGACWRGRPLAGAWWRGGPLIGAWWRGGPVIGACWRGRPLAGAWWRGGPLAGVWWRGGPLTGAGCPGGSRTGAGWPGGPLTRVRGRGSRRAGAGWRTRRGRARRRSRLSETWPRSRLCRARPNAGRSLAQPPAWPAPGYRGLAGPGPRVGLRWPGSRIARWPRPCARGPALRWPSVRRPCGRRRARGPALRWPSVRRPCGLRRRARGPALRWPSVRRPCGLRRGARRSVLLRSLARARPPQRREEVDWSRRGARRALAGRRGRARRPTRLPRRGPGSWCTGCGLLRKSGAGRGGGAPCQGRRVRWRIYGLRVTCRARLIHAQIRVRRADTGNRTGRHVRHDRDGLGVSQARQERGLCPGNGERAVGLGSARYQACPARTLVPVSLRRGILAGGARARVLGEWSRAPVIGGGWGWHATKIQARLSFAHNQPACPQ